jgi:hypothetical protein
MSGSKTSGARSSRQDPKLGTCRTRIQPRAHDVMDQQCGCDPCDACLRYCKPARWDFHQVTAGSAGSFYPRADDSRREFARGVRVRAAGNAPFPCVTDHARRRHGCWAWSGGVGVCAQMENSHSVGIWYLLCCRICVRFRDARAELRSRGAVASVPLSFLAQQNLVFFAPAPESDTFPIHLSANTLA